MVYKEQGLAGGPRWASLRCDYCCSCSRPSPLASWTVGKLCLAPEPMCTPAPHLLKAFRRRSGELDPVLDPVQSRARLGLVWRGGIGWGCSSCGRGLEAAALKGSEDILLGYHRRAFLSL